MNLDRWRYERLKKIKQVTYNVIVLPDALDHGAL
jgi:hypothetical protein